MLSPNLLHLVEREVPGRRSGRGSDGAKNVTGTTLFVDGGWIAPSPGSPTISAVTLILARASGSLVPA